MGKTFSKEVQKDLKLIGWYQVVTGSCGVLIAGSILSDGIYQLSLVFIIALSLFIFCIVCGWLCIKANKSAIILSLVNQCCQSVSFLIGGLGYACATVYVLIGFHISHSFRFVFDWGLPKFWFLINGNTNDVFIAINIPALALTYWLYRLKTHDILERSIDEADSIGDQ